MTRPPSSIHCAVRDRNLDTIGYDNPDLSLRRFDPKLYLSNLAVAVSPVKGSAKAALMAWMLELPCDMDPARAASGLLDLPLFSGIEEDEGEASELVGLLRQVSRFSRETLAAMPRGRRRHLHA